MIRSYPLTRIAGFGAKMHRRSRAFGHSVITFDNPLGLIRLA
jgi:hypothetical protein